MKDVYYGFKLGVGFLVSQLVFAVVGFGIGIGVLYGLGLGLTHPLGH